MFFPFCKKKSTNGQRALQRKVRFSEPKLETVSTSDSKRTLSVGSLDRRFIELKLVFKKARRRIVVDDRLSYHKLVKEISKLFGIAGTFSVYYEDDEKDIIKVSTTVEVRAMLLVAMRRSGCTHVFVQQMEQK